MSTGNLDDFDAGSVEPRTAFEPLPAGDYEAIVSASAMEPTKAGDGEFLKLTLTMVGKGPHENRTLFDRLNLKNANPKAVEIARASLSSLCRACGVLRPGDSAALHNIPIIVKVALKKRADTGELSNEVKGYCAIGGEAPAAAKSTNKKPWQK